MGKRKKPRHLGIKGHAVVQRYGYYVYYLCWRDEVVYVGQSSSVLGRLGAHTSGRKAKAFDTVIYRECESEAAMYELEKREIARLRPKLNVRDNPDALDVVRIYCVLCGKYLNASYWYQQKDDVGRSVPLCWRCNDAWSPPINERPNAMHARQYEQRVEALALLWSRGNELRGVS